MTNQEAIEIIKKDGWGYPENMHTEAVMMAIDALEKRSEAEEYRTPKSPDEDYEETLDGEYFNGYKCPACKHHIDYGGAYCSWCGQALNWREAE